MRNKQKTIFWSLLVIIFLLFTIMFALRTFHRYEVWKGHEEYLKGDNKTIEDWMPPNLIEKDSGIPKELIYNELGIEATFTNNRKPLSKLCIQKDINCTIVVERLRVYSLQIKQGTKRE